MTHVNIYEAKTHLSKLVDAAAAGETIVIAKAGRPMAKLSRVDARPAPQRLGFLAGGGRVPEDFDTMGSEEIGDAFEDRR